MSRVANSFLSAAVAGALALSVAAGCSPARASIHRDASHDAIASIAPRERVVVAIFMATDCPIGNAYQPEIERLRAQFEPLGMTFVGVYAEVPLTDEEARAHANAYGIRYATRIDADCALQRALGVRIVPEAVVLDEADSRGNRRVLYQGRIDDRWIERGARRASATTHDLEDALTSIAAGSEPRVSRTIAVGCTLGP
jgi:hypothetical protein